MFIYSKNIIKEEQKYSNYKIITFKSENENSIKIKPDKNIHISFISENIIINEKHIKDKSKIILNMKNTDECEILFVNECVLNKFITSFDNYEPNKSIKISKLDDYYSLISNFEKDYNIEDSIKKFEIDKLINYRYFCYKYIEFSRTYKIPELIINNTNNCVIVEFNNYPHIEFTIRNSIHKLNNNWTYTIVCCDDNYEFIKNICNTISSNIILVKYTKCVNYNDYNNMLLDIHFWNLLSGEKILLFQEDTLILKKEFDHFMKYDYIGMIYHILDIDNNQIRMGNTGITFLNKDLIINILNNYDYKKEKENQKIIKYRELLQLDKYPADIFFSKTIIKNNLGIVADKEMVDDFVFSYYFNDDSFSFHHGWQRCKDWKNILYGKLITKKYNKKYIINDLDNVKLKIILIKGKLSEDITDKYPIYYGEVGNDYYLYVNGHFDININQITTLFENFKTSNANILSPIIFGADNKLEYFGGVLDNNGKLIMIDENIIPANYINYKIAWNSYIQNTIIAYPNLFISKYKFDIESILDKCIELNNVKIDPFVQIINNKKNNFDMKSKYVNTFEINLSQEYLKDIFKKYLNLNLISFKFFKDTYYLTLNKNKYILFIEDSPITPDNDCGSLYMYHYINTFIKLGYNIHFLPLNFYKHGKYTEMLNKMGIYQAYEFPYSIEYHIKNNYNVYDYIFISRLSAIRKTYNIIKKYCKQSKIIFITHDLSHIRLERENKLPKNELNKIKEEELGYIDKCDLSVIVSEYEYELLKDRKVYYSPICYKIEDDYDRIIENTNDIYFIGSSHAPNLDAVSFFLLTHWKNIIKKIDIKLHVIGKGFDKIRLNNYKNVIFHGFVEDSHLNDIIKQCRINIVPLRYGAGIKGKILQSSNLKIPCVSSPVGAEGMKFENNKDIVVLDFNSDHFVNEFIKIYNDLNLLKELSDNCYETMKNNYSLDMNEKYIKNMLLLL
jgi:hypothetical protein